jgi:hypothetical protein
MGMNASGSTYNWGTLTTGWQMQNIFVQSGVWEMSPDTCIGNLAPLSADQVAKELTVAGATGEMATSKDEVPQTGGGLSDLFGKAKSIVSGVAKGVKNVVNNDIFKDALNVASQLSGSGLRRHKTKKHH